MSAINDRLDPFCTRHLANLFDGRDLTGDVYLMRNEDELRSIRDSSFECCCDLVQVLGWNRDLHQLEQEAFTTLALAQRGQHARVVLRRGKDFIAGFEIHSHQKNLERL